MSHRLIRLASAIVIATAVTGVANAQKTNDTNFYIAPFGSFISPDADSQSHDGWGAGGAIGKVVNEYLNIEARGFWQHYDNRFSCCTGNSTLLGGTVDAQLFLMRDQFSPYIVGAIGGMNTASVIDSPLIGHISKENSSFIFEAGVGSYYNVYQNIALRSDIRYRLNTLPSEVGSSQSVFNDLVVNFGFVVPIGF